MDELPASVSRYFQALTFGGRALAWLQLDGDFIVRAAGGDLAAYGLALQVGALAAGQAPFLEGLLPLAEEPYLVPAVELSPGRVADLHFHAAADGLWVMLLEVTAERDASRRMQQKAYDMTLLQEREALLNRRLAAANAALEAARAELAAWNRTLEERVAAQVAEIERISRLKRFLAPSVAELIVSSGNERVLDSHRRDIAALFIDLRGFTPFSETAEPEEVMELLRDYHGAVVPLIQSFEGTLDRFVGDGMLVYFNDPLPCPDPAARAVQLAVALREAVSKLGAVWRGRGHQIGCGFGIAQGYATLGQIGFEGRLDYSAIGTAINTASRLCAAAKDGQILVTSRVAMAVAAIAEMQEIGQLTLKGLTRPLLASNVLSLKAAPRSATAA